MDIWSYKAFVGPIVNLTCTQAAVVYLNLRAGSTFPVPVCTVSPGHSIGLASATILTRSDFIFHIGADLLLPKGQRCVCNSHKLWFTFNQVCSPFNFPDIKYIIELLYRDEINQDFICWILLLSICPFPRFIFLYIVSVSRRNNRSTESL